MEMEVALNMQPLCLFCVVLDRTPCTTRNDIPGTFSVCIFKLTLPPLLWAHGVLSRGEQHSRPLNGRLAREFIEDFLYLWLHHTVEKTEKNKPEGEKTPRHSDRVE